MQTSLTLGLSTLGLSPETESTAAAARSTEAPILPKAKRLRRWNANTSSDWRRAFPNYDATTRKTDELVQSEKENIVQHARALIEKNQFLPARDLLLPLQNKTGQVLSLLQQVNQFLRAEEPPITKTKKSPKEKMEANLRRAMKQQEEEPKKKLIKHRGEIPASFRISKGISREIVNESKQIAGKPVGIVHCQGIRPTMEDCHLATEFSFTSQGGEFSGQLYGVFDGHGGTKSASFVSKNLSHFLKITLEKHNSSTLTEDGIYYALRDCFMDLDNACVDFRDGTTATVAFVLNGKVYVANAGDSRTILSDRGVHTQLSQDANLSDERVQEKIIKLGGSITQKVDDAARIQGLVAVGGALGDRYIIGDTGDCCVPPQPQVTVHSYTKEDGVLLLGCDGIFTVASTNDTMEWVKQLKEQGETVDQITRRLVYSTLVSKTTDNVTIMLVQL